MSKTVCNSPVIVALDFARPDAALDFVQQLDPRQCRLKVGKELFTQAGPALVERLQHAGFEVFLDLKFHDIPNTVAAAVAIAADLGVWMVNVHASGGRRMMMAARERIAQKQSATLLTAVTVLTSMEAADLAEVGIDVEPILQVSRLAKLAAECHLHGVVCSAQEAVMLRQQLPKEFLLVTPGIRPADAQADDQRRIMTPPQAIAAGVDYLVIGRPITQSVNPLTALNSINRSLK
ncbi:MAG: orotidine-5'-phosphate decarboxylase [Moraxellaceae bacterium]|nr:orotidine-5'-phosphate decarboxylase [Moraxellaceae bacterium]MDZ4298429.1 orotidine-5'-phosphate decarboxylase [Moraxellaceae bacterium]MDZ4387176.1 orotidine-5'-phosphate decarboxylase [Moraxellaceae bacterium]